VLLDSSKPKEIGNLPSGQWLACTDRKPPNLSSGCKSIFRSDITQSLAFTAFLRSPDQVTDTLIKLSEVALQPNSNTFSHAPKLAVASSRPFDPKISYTQILQEYTQSQLDRGRPQFTMTWHGKSHERIHRAICAYRDLSTEGTGGTVKHARNVAAYQMLNCLADQADEQQIPA
jgi:hypothetical protein